MNEILSILNGALVALSVSGIVHVLQAKFASSKVLQTTSLLQYYALRGGFVALATAQLASLLFAPNVLFMASTVSIGLITHLVSNNFE